MSDNRSPYVTLDLGAIAHNFQRIREQVPRARIMAVIKANAYGHGLLRVAQALPSADGFAVARLGEGLTLRRAGIRQRIAVLQGFNTRDELDQFAAFHLEPVIHGLAQIEMLEAAALAEPIPVWLKLDSGMHRLGLLPDDFPGAFERLRVCRSVQQPIPVMTHLASADDAADAATPRQLDVFRTVAGGLNAPLSVANSAGVLAWDAAHADWVRPGVALYGISPFADRCGIDLELRPVMTFRTRLISIKQLAAGEPVGYGGDWICPRATRLGVAAVGYGDGYPRHARSGTPVMVHGCLVPLVGRVSMDMITVDLTDCPVAEVGDEVTLWGHGLPVEEIARCAETIPYELVCGVTQRVGIEEIGG